MRVTSPRQSQDAGTVNGHTIQENFVLRNAKKVPEHHKDGMFSRRAKMPDYVVRTPQQPQSMWDFLHAVGKGNQQNIDYYSNQLLNVYHYGSGGAPWPAAFGQMVEAPKQRSFFGGGSGQMTSILGAVAALPNHGQAIRLYNRFTNAQIPQPSYAAGFSPYDIAISNQNFDLANIIRPPAYPGAAVSANPPAYSIPDYPGLAVTPSTPPAYSSVMPMGANLART